MTTRPETNAPGPPVKGDIRDFYDDISRRFGRSKVGDFAHFLNLGYVSLGAGDEAPARLISRRLDPTSARLAFELVGTTELHARRVLDVGCGRGGNAVLLAEAFGADVTGIDLAPEAIAFCRRRHRQSNVHFDVGDAECLPVETASMDVVTNVESSHVYPDLHGFFSEVRRVLKPGGIFLYTDVFPAPHWERIRTMFASLSFDLFADRDITQNVLASCDVVAARRAKAFGAADAQIENFLAVPGSSIYEQMRSGTLEYRLLRARRR